MSEELEKHVLRRYEVTAKMGKGAYGIVWRVIDKKTKYVLASTPFKPCTLVTAD
jgi:mitogen-activated protein kinase 15